MESRLTTFARLTLFLQRERVLDVKRFQTEDDADGDKDDEHSFRMSKYCRQSCWNHFELSCNPQFGIQRQFQIKTKTKFENEIIAITFNLGQGIKKFNFLLIL